MLTAGIYISVTLAFVAAFVLVPRFVKTERQALRRRFAREFDRQSATTSDGVALYKDPASMSRAVEGERLDPVDLAIAHDKPKRVKPTLWQRLERVVQEADVFLPASAIVGLGVGTALVAAVCGWCLLRWPGAIAGGMAGGGLPLAAILWRRRSIRDKTLVQLPGAFTLMARVLRSGQSIDQAMLAVADAFQEPLAREFALCHEQQELGLRQEVILRDMAQRSGILELRIFAMAVIIQRQVGGNLSEVLDRLADMVRERLTLKQQIRTLTAEGRLQGWTLVVLPIVVFAITYFLNRQYAQLLLDRKELLLATAGSMTAGILWIRRIVRFEE